MFFDLDNFKSINDTFGHQIGDELLKEVARTLLDNPVIGGHVYRHGGDEFVVFFDNASSRDVEKTVNLLLSLFEKPWRVGEHEITCRSSIGVAVYPDDGRCVEELIHSADMMMYEAKRQGKGTACFRDGHTVVPKS
jgi:diguanylate cyclase (GGDEF) domain